MTDQLGVSLEQLSGTEGWRNLSPAAKRVLTAAFTETNYDLVAAVHKVHPMFDSAKALQVAEHLLANPGSRPLITARLGYAPNNVRRLIADDVQEPKEDDAK